MRKELGPCNPTTKSMDTDTVTLHSRVTTAEDLTSILHDVITQLETRLEFVLIPDGACPKVRSGEEGRFEQSPMMQKITNAVHLWQ